MQKDQFMKQLADSGYTETRDHVYEPNLDVEMHTHDFSVMLLVTEGKFELVLEGSSTQYGPGEWCELPAGTLHAEKCGPDGAKAFLGTKTG